MVKTRLDAYLLEQGKTDSREKARSLIMAGQVYINNQKADKAGMPVREGDLVEIRGNQNPFVSRGGLKLQKAVEGFGLNLTDQICMDVGASTGGFTDCMLQNGAQKVYAVDVGYGQLAWKLRTDARVVNLERTNIRYVEQQQIDPLDMCSVDVSFISLTLVLPVVYKLLKEQGQAVCLVKPQFEAGREKVGKKGVVREKETHREVLQKIIGFAIKTGFSVCGMDFSPIKGPEGNIEYLLLLTKNADDALPDENKINQLVEASHEMLD